MMSPRYAAALTDGNRAAILRRYRCGMARGSVYTGEGDYRIEGLAA